MKTDDLLHCEEQLRTTLHCDDKEKLRRKLAQLQREYLRTAQRLQRAERQEAVRRHVRSRISQQNQTDAEARSETASLLLKSSDGNVPGVPDDQEPPKHSADANNSRKSQTISFVLPPDAACPQTPDPVTQSEPRPSSALRLRSRRSRLRLERRSAEVRRSTDNAEKGHDLSEHDGTAGEEEKEEAKVKSSGFDAVHESEELFSSTESESPSLLLTHWNVHGDADTEDVVGKTVHQEKDTHFRAIQKNDSDSRSQLLTCGIPLIQPAEKRNDITGNRSEVGKNEDSNSREASDLKLNQENCNEAAEKIKSDQNSSFQESCTIVEGLLFPAEYYVRTTRRMSSSQAQPDLQAVILSQLNAQRPRRGRGRGRGQSKSIAKHSDWHNQPDLPSQKTASSSADPLNSAVERFGENSDSILHGQIELEAVSSPPVTKAPPARGRRKRGRGRPRAKRSTSVPTSQCPSIDGTTLCATPKETFLVPEEAGLAPSRSTDSQLSPAVNETQSTSGSGQQKVFPVFLKSVMKTALSPQRNSGSAILQPLLLPSSSPAPTSPLHLPSLSPLLPVKGLSASSVQDFYLPDEQFASLKFQKLRNVAMELGIEHFSSPSHNTRSSYRRSNLLCFGANDPVTLLPLPLSLTPTVSDSPHADDRQAAPLSENLQNLLTEHKHRDELISQPSTDIDMTGNCKEEMTENLQAEIHSNTLCPVSAAQVIDGGDCRLTHEEDKTLPLYGKSVGCPKTNEQAPLKSDQGNCHGEDQRPLNTQVEAAFSIECPLRDKEIDPFACLQTTGSPGDSPANHLNGKSPSEVLKHFCEADVNLPAGALSEDEKDAAHTELLLSSPSSAPCNFITPRLPSSTLTSSPVLPSLGITPHPDAVSFPLTSSPSAPPRSLPLPPPPPPPPAALFSSSSVSHSGVELQGSGGQTGLTTKAEECFKTHISHTLKAAAGGSLVDACCFIEPSGALCVAAAGKWAVCLWSQTSASDWSLKHTWTFNKPVVNVFPVPDTAGLMCVTLGQLEIREVRMLSSSKLTQKLTCEGVLQAVIGLSGSRVATSSPSVTGSILQVFTLSDSSSSPSPHSLASPGVCVVALAPVDGLSNALLGTDESGHLFVWNLKSGQLLCQVAFGEDLTHTACLRGYSHCGVLFVLLQHHFLSSLEKEEEKKRVKGGEKRGPFLLGRN